MRNTSQLKEYVYEEADEYPSFELDAVRQVANDDEGVTLRILVEDAEDESDQIGFQVTRPDMEQGRQMFNKRVLNGLRELRDRYRDDRDSSSRDIEPSTDSETDTDPVDRSTEVADQQTGSRGSQQRDIGGEPLGPLEVTLSLDNDAEAELVEEFESLVEEIDELTASQESVDDLDERLNDVENRLTQLEEALSMVGK